VIVNEKTLLQTLDGEIFCFNYLTGEEIWRKSLATEIRNSPAFIGDKMITVTLDGRILALEYTSGVILWEQELNEPVFADPVIEGKRIYIISHRGRLSVLNINDGEIVHQSALNVQTYIGPTIDDKHIFVCLSDGRLIVLDKITFEVFWSFNGDGPISGSALVTDSYVYLTSLGKKFYVLNKNDGQLLQTINLPGRARSTPLINKGKLILGCEDKQVIAYVEKP
jgi:outer membrane protein assembly factor BamB